MGDVISVKVKTFRDLIVWQRGMDLTRAIYRGTEKMPRTEVFGLTSQMRRAASSIPLNIAEGFGKYTRPEVIHGLRTATGSLLELMTSYEIATSLGMIKEDRRVVELLAEEDRLLQSLVSKLSAKERLEKSGATRSKRSR